MTPRITVGHPHPAPKGPPMLGRNLAFLTIVIAALMVGAAVGISYQLPVKVEQFACSVDSPSATTPRCPPDDDRVVWATWDPGVRTPARWDGRKWVFVEPVLGQHGTTYHPSNWGEL